MAKLRLVNTVKSMIGSGVVSSRQTNATSANTASIARKTMSCESNQSSRSPQSSVSCSAPKPTIMSTSPGTSMRPGFLRCLASVRKALTSRKPSTPIGRLM